MARPAADAAIIRHGALAGSEIANRAVRIAVLPPAGRISLRAPKASVAPLSDALGLDLPIKPRTSAAKGGRTALWLGPDEWLVIDQKGGDLPGDCASVKDLHSAVAVSHRNVAFSIAGPGAEATLNAGCPQDLSLPAFPLGACSRTILGKVEVVLLRTGEDAFRLECWRSFAEYAFDFLTQAAADAGA